MARVKDLLVEARSDLPSAPDFSIERALKRAARRFFRDSGVWRERLSPITVRTGRIAYSLPAPTSGARVERVLSVYYGEQLVPVVPEADLFSGNSEQVGPPQACAVRSHTDELVIWPAPTATENGQTMRVFGVIVPGDKTESIPNPLLEEWGEGIVSGAKWEMMSMPAMPWTQLERASDHERKFYEEVARAKREATSGSSAPLRVKPVRFF